ncbi:MAG: CRTAC1 family protein [Planctomycetota bacterium]
MTLNAPESQPNSPPRSAASATDEWVPADDAVIGRAFRTSLWILLALAIGVGLWFWLSRAPQRKEVVEQKDLSHITAKDLEKAAAAPAIEFTDITRAAGIHFQHSNGATGQKLLPETLGSGCAFFDFDSDGDQDLALVNSCSWPEDPAPAERPTQRLYRNDGSGKFDDVTKACGLDATFYGTGIATGDYDGDGDTDLFFTAVGANHLYRNDAGQFVAVTDSAGVAGASDGWHSSAGFFDYDRDGDLDLFVCKYVVWSRAIDLAQEFSINGQDRAYGPPTNFQGTFPCLYRNDGHGRFTDVSDAAGLHVVNPANGQPVAKALGVCFVDVDRDGYLDVLVANDTTQNFFFRNDGRGAFAEIGQATGFAFDVDGIATGAMGIDAAYFRNDEALAVGIGNFANQPTSFYVRQSNNLYWSDDAVLEGLGAATRVRLKFGVLFFDADLDGRLDFFQANGHLEEEIAEVQVSQQYRQAAQLFWNRGPSGRGAFTEIPPTRLGDLPQPLVGRAAAYADIDADGDLDLCLTQVAGPPALLRNDQQLGHNWVRLELRGRGGNTGAIGATVELVAGGIRQRQCVQPTRSYLSQVELPLTFGLGAASAVESIAITWPDGSASTLPTVALNRLTVVSQP